MSLMQKNTAAIKKILAEIRKKSHDSKSTVVNRETAI